MATIPTTYTYTDGNVLVPASHNSNIYSGTGSEGIMSEPNGGLDNDNLTASFEVQSEHIWPGEVVRMRQETFADDSDYMSDAVGTDGATGFLTVAGLSCRVYLPYAVSFGLWTWSYFSSDWRYVQATPNPDTEAGIAMRTLVNGLHGADLAHTQRRVPPTGHVDITTTPPDIVRSREGCCATWRNQTHLSESMAAGWHELDVRLTMEIRSDTWILGRLGNTVTHRFYNRMSYGMRNVNFIGFL